MNDNRRGGMMFVAGSIAGLITMGFHPVGHGGIISLHEMERLALLNRAVHGLGIASLPAMFLGALALNRRLTTSNPVSLAALAVYAFALVAIMVAAAMSGFVGSAVMSRLVAGDPATETGRLLLDYTFQVNQAFAAVFVVGSCAAIMLWSLVVVKTRRLPVGLGIYGMILGFALLAALCSGNLPLNVHGFGLVMLTQSIWFTSAGIGLMHSSDGNMGSRLAAPTDSSTA